MAAIRRPCRVRTSSATSWSSLDRQATPRRSAVPSAATYAASGPVTSRKLSAEASRTSSSPKPGDPLVSTGSEPSGPALGLRGFRTASAQRHEPVATVLGDARAMSAVADQQHGAGDRHHHPAVGGELVDECLRELARGGRDQHPVVRRLGRPAEGVGLGELDARPGPVSAFEVAATERDQVRAPAPLRSPCPRARSGGPGGRSSSRTRTRRPAPGHRAGPSAAAACRRPCAAGSWSARGRSGSARRRTRGSARGAGGTTTAEWPRTLRRPDRCRCPSVRVWHFWTSGSPGGRAPNPRRAPHLSGRAAADPRRTSVARQAARAEGQRKRYEQQKKQERENDEDGASG